MFHNVLCLSEDFNVGDARLSQLFPVKSNLRGNRMSA